MMMGETPKTRSGLRAYWPVLVVVALAAGALGIGTTLGGADDENDDDAGPGSDRPPALAAFPDEDPLEAPDCDAETGRLAVPSLNAPDCVPIWPDDRDNGGETHPGVTGDEIVVAVYEPQVGGQGQALIDSALGDAAPSEEEDDANRESILDAYQALYETYGREVRMVTVDATGPGDDDAAARADAIRIAEDIGAFAAIGGPAQTNAYAEELAAREVLCLCLASQPNSVYEDLAPYAWGSLMSSTQGYRHRAEYVTERLAGRPAELAGDPELQDDERSFALVYYETADGAYEAGADFFEEQLAEDGVELTDRIPYVLDLSRAQEDAGTVVARLKDAGVTSVIFAGGPAFPIYLTQAATDQDYSPEWIITGSTGTDTAVAARQFDQEQWAHAFGISFLTARVEEEAEAGLNLANWYHGEELSSYPQYYDLGRLFTGIHLAGPELRPGTFRDALFSVTPTSGHITAFAVSYGEDVWPSPDYTGADDVTEIWWDADATGPDEVGNEGQGLYRYVDGGRRFMPGEIGESSSTPFDEEGTVTIHPEIPEGDRPPDYTRRTSRTD